MITRKELIEEYEKKLAAARFSGPADEVEVYEEILEILNSEASVNEIYHDYRWRQYEDLDHEQIWHIFIDDDIASLDDDEDDNQNNNEIDQ